jgi:hypothetical protein
MAMILQRLTRALSPTVIGEIAKTAHLEPAFTTRGMAAVGPVVVLALADKAALPGGPATVFQMLPAHGSTLLGEFAFVARAGVPGTVLIPVLGSGMNAVGDTLDRTLGFKASRLLPVAVAVVLGLTARIAEEQDLDDRGVAELLAAEAMEFRKADGPDVGLVRDALDAGRHAILVKARYSPEEWEAVRLAPMAAAQLVMVEDESYPLGVIEQITAAAHAVDEAKKSAPATSIVTLAFERDFTVDELTRFTKRRTRADALTAVREAMETISRMSPSDVPRFRRLVEDVASCVAAVTHPRGVEVPH